MCPACLANAAMAAASVTSSGGVTAFAVRIIRLKRKAKQSELKKLVQRRNGDGYWSEQGGKSENRAAG